MPLIPLRALLDHAAENDYGVPAFNVNNLEQTRAIMEAADATNSPVIMQASAGARKYAGAPFLRAMMEAAMNEFPHIPVVVHQDHGLAGILFGFGAEAGDCQLDVVFGPEAIDSCRRRANLIHFDWLGRVHDSGASRALATQRVRDQVPTRRRWRRTGTRP